MYKCHYCDFNSHAFLQNDIPFQPYAKSLLTEIKHRKNLYEKEGNHFFEPGQTVDTVFVGGGTPSLMNPKDLEMVLEALNQSFIFDDRTEITLEANPKTISLKKLADFKSAGVNRLSVGIQSLHDAYLGSLGRIHTSDEAREALLWVAGSRFASWNADLIYGFPGQTFREWQKELKEMVGFGPSHLSCYALTVEKGTLYEKKIAQGLVQAPLDDLQAAMQEWVFEFLSKEGFKVYEISNYAKPGFESRHNLNYWNYGPFVALGAGAVSFLYEKREGQFLGYRTTNFKSPNKYMEAVKDRGSQVTDPWAQDGDERTMWFDTELISQSMAMSEFMMMGLRLDREISTQRFYDLFGVGIEKQFGNALAQERQRGRMDSHQISLTPLGQKLANLVVQSFL